MNADYEEFGKNCVWLNLFPVPDVRAGVRVMPAVDEDMSRVFHGEDEKEEDIESRSQSL